MYYCCLLIDNFYSYSVDTIKSDKKIASAVTNDKFIIDLYTLVKFKCFYHDSSYERSFVTTQQYTFVPSFIHSYFFFCYFHMFFQSLHLLRSLTFSFFSATFHPVYVRTGSQPPFDTPKLFSRHFSDIFVLSSSLCIRRYLSSSQPLTRCPSIDAPSPFVFVFSRLSSDLSFTASNPICYQPSLISAPLSNVNPAARSFGMSIDLSRHRLHGIVQNLSLLRALLSFFEENSCRDTLFVDIPTEF